MVSILDAEGSTFERREVELVSSTERISLDLPILAVTGRLTRGGEPLQAQMELTDGGARVVRVTTREDGTFREIFPHAGRWYLELPTESPGVGGRHLYGAVEVEHFEGSREGRLEIDLPGGVLAGTVVDRSGKPVSPSLVTVHRGMRIVMQVRGDAEGRFEAQGLEPGEHTVVAEALGDRFSQVRNVEIGDIDPESVELRVETRRTVPGRVRSAGRPVASARVKYFAVGTPERASLTTEPSGRFEIHLSRAVRELDLVVVAPGLPAKIQRVSLSQSGSSALDLHIGPSGELILGLEGQQFLRHGEVVVPLSTLFYPSGADLRGFDAQRGLLSVEIEAGEYAICSTSRSDSKCASGYLSPGGQLVLDYRDGR